MSKEKFTPGPWRCSKKTDFVVVGENEDEIADASCGDNSQANTNLIAAAPDLYEAIKKMQKIILDDDLQETVPPLFWEISGAALEKARGE